MYSKEYLKSYRRPWAQAIGGTPLHPRLPCMSKANPPRALFEAAASEALRHSLLNDKWEDALGFVQILCRGDQPSIEAIWKAAVAALVGLGGHEQSVLRVLSCAHSLAFCRQAFAYAANGSRNEASAVMRGRGHGHEKERRRLCTQLLRERAMRHMRHAPAGTVLEQSLRPHMSTEPFLEPLFSQLAFQLLNESFDARLQSEAKVTFLSGIAMLPGLLPAYAGFLYKFGSLNALVDLMECAGDACGLTKTLKRAYGLPVYAGVREPVLHGDIGAFLANFDYRVDEVGDWLVLLDLMISHRDEIAEILHTKRQWWYMLHLAQHQSETNNVLRALKCIVAAVLESEVYVLLRQAIWDGKTFPDCAQGYLKAFSLSVKYMHGRLEDFPQKYSLYRFHKL